MVAQLLERSAVHRKMQMKIYTSRDVTWYRLVYRCIEYIASHPRQQERWGHCTASQRILTGEPPAFINFSWQFLHTWPHSLNYGVLHNQTNHLNTTETVQVIKKNGFNSKIKSFKLLAPAFKAHCNVQRPEFKCELHEKVIKLLSYRTNFLHFEHHTVWWVHLTSSNKRLKFHYRSNMKLPSFCSLLQHSVQQVVTNAEQKPLFHLEDEDRRSF
jgi:hypothetical protein